jgi:hypothetical protein
MAIHPNTRQCTHLKVDGHRCGAPALTGKPRCHFHNHIFRRPKEFILPPLEDANSVQVTIMEVMRALLEGRLERANAGTLLYACQIAQSNLRNLSLAPAEKNMQDEEDNMSLAALLLRELRDTPDHDEDHPKDQDAAIGKKPQQNASTTNLTDHPLLQSVTTGSRTG